MDALLEKSRSKNAENQLTGMLCFDGKVFIQILEGPVTQIEATYSKILSDSRHGHIEQIYSGEIRERSFNDWYMGYQFLSPLTGAELEHAWKECEARLAQTENDTETRGVTFFKFLRDNKLRLGSTD